MRPRFRRHLAPVFAFAVALVVADVWPQPPRPEWTRIYGNPSESERGYSVVETHDGGYIVAGVGPGDAWLVKTDKQGDTVWTRAIGTPGRDEYALSVQQTSDGGYVLTGASSLFPNADDLLLAKTDENGSLTWLRTYGGLNTGEVGYSVRQTADGGYAAVGYYGSGAGLDVWLIRTDSLGDSMWARAYGGAGSDEGHSLLTTSDGGYVIAGYTYSGEAGGTGVWLIRTDANGDTIWTRTYGTTGSEMGSSVQGTPDGGYIVAGYSPVHGGDIYVVRTDAAGSVLWTTTHGSQYYDWGYSVDLVSDSGFIITGTTETTPYYSDVYLVKLRANGEVEWDTCYGPSDWDVGYSVRVTSDGGYIIAGYTTTPGSYYYDVYLIKTTPESSVQEKNLPMESLDSPSLVAIATRDELVIRYLVARAGTATLRLYDLTGAVRATVVKHDALPGTHEVRIDRSRLSPGVYVLQLRTHCWAATQKVVVP